MATIRGFIFDLDGVITETSEFHYQAWQRLADENGLPFDRQANDALRGISRRESLLKILDGRPVSEDQIQAMMHTKNNYYVDYLQTMTPDNRLAGVTDFLTESRAIGLKLAIGSASRNARLVLDKIGLGAFFDAVGDGHMVVNSKPAPDVFVWTAGALGLPVTEVVVFEDASAGIDAAKTAGTYSVGVGSANVDHADITLPDLTGITPRMILTQLAAGHSTHG